MRDSSLYWHQNATNPPGADMVKPPHSGRILTSDEDMVSRLEYGAGIGLSDHVVFSYTLNVIPTTTNKSKSGYAIRTTTSK